MLSGHARLTSLSAFSCGLFLGIRPARPLFSSPPAGKESQTLTFRDPVRQVFISQSVDACRNLALEDWLYRHHDFRHKHLLLLWHQRGNLHCVFFTRQSPVDRERNVNVVCKAVDRVAVGSEIGRLCREAFAKAGECQMHEAGKSVEAEPRSSQTVRVPLSELFNVDPTLMTGRLIEALGWEFLRTSADGADRGMKVANHQRGFQMVRPDEDWFPGIDQLCQDFQAHAWLFEKAQVFQMQRHEKLPGASSEPYCHEFKDVKVRLR